MTTRQFIQREWNNDNDTSKSCSSVYKDYHGNIYSYGTHYPLLFSLYNLNFINVAGYSSTTGRHIYWARQAVDNLHEDYIAVKLRHGDFDAYQPMDSFNRIVVSLQTERDRLWRELVSRTRHNTAVYRQLKRQLDQIDSDLTVCYAVQADR